MTNSTRPSHSFRSHGQNMIVAKALMRHAILNNPQTIATLNYYLKSLHLAQRVNTGKLSEVEALIEFEKAIHNFARRLHTELNKQWTNKALDQTDLSIPINMETALNNPYSVTSQMANDAVIAIEEAITNEIMLNADAMEQNIENEQAIENTEHATPEETNSSDKTQTFIDAVTLFDEKGADAAKDKIESAFFKETGIKTEFHKEETADVHSILEKVLKPEFKDFMKDDDKTRG